MIKIEKELKTSVTYNGTGTQTRFDFPFDYLRKSFVHVSVDNTTMNTDQYTIDGRTVVFNTAPASGSVIRIYRETDTTRLVVWADASVLKASDMTIQQVQQLHILEETNDWTKSSSIVLNDEGTAWQGRNYRLTNLANPVNSQDAVTKYYLDNEENSFSSTMNAIKNQTEAMANNASTSANNAKKSEANAKLSETYAKRSETQSKTSELAAKDSETAAAASAKAAKEAADNANSYAGNAKSNADLAQTYMGTTQNYRDTTKTYMDNAKNYSENVNVFTPSVSEDGVLSWTNKAGLPNPPSVNIKGADGGVTIDTELSSTSKNPVQNKVIHNALLNKAGTDIFSGFDFLSPSASIRWRSGSQVYGMLSSSNYSGTALRATQDADGNIITETYAKKTDITGGGGGSSVTVDTELSSTSTNPVQNKVIYEALDTKLGKNSVAYGALRDAEGNFITSTYVKSVNGVKPDIGGNVTLNVSGGGGGSSVTVDTELSSTSTNPIANKAVYTALQDKISMEDIEDGFTLISGTSSIVWNNGANILGRLNATNYSGTAAKATADADGNTISTTYAKKTEVTSALADKLGKTETAAKATADADGNTISTTYAKKADINGVVKSVNGTTPDASGNVTLETGGGGVSTSTENTWTGTQEFYTTKTYRTSHMGYYVEGTSDSPVTDTMWYKATGAFTLDLTSLGYLLSTYESLVFSAYFTADADYALTINGAGTMTYVESASDIAISSSGTLLTIWMINNPSGVVSIVQAHKLGSA